MSFLSISKGVKASSTEAEAEVEESNSEEEDVSSGNE